MGINKNQNSNDVIRADSTLVSRSPIQTPVQSIPNYTGIKISNEPQTRQKHYSTDLLGFISSIVDKITGNDTEVVDPHDQGEIKQDNRSDFGRYMDNQLQHNNTPLGYMYRTVMPAAAIAGAIINPAATGLGVVGGAVGGAAFNGASNLITGKSWEENVRDYTGNELAFLTNPGAWVGGAAGGKVGSRIDTGVSTRRTRLNTRYNNHPDTQPLENAGYEYGKKTGVYLYAKPKTLDIVPLTSETHQTNGGAAYIPAHTNSENPQLHLNPDIYYRNIDLSIIGSKPTRRTAVEGIQILKLLPDGVPLSQNENAVTLGQAFQRGNYSYPGRLRYILTGKMPKSKEPLKVVEGYSTDIYKTMSDIAKHGHGYLEESAATRINGTNAFGKSYNELKNYFPKPDEDGNINFKDMSPEQVTRWNAEMADKYGMHIDPKTRTAEQYIFVTGKDPVLQNNLLNKLRSYSGLLSGVGTSTLIEKNHNK